MDDLGTVMKYIDRSRFVSLKSDLLLLEKKIEEINRRFHGSPSKKNRRRPSSKPSRRFQYSPQSQFENLIRFLEMHQQVNEKTIELEKLVLTQSQAGNLEGVIRSEYSHLPYYFKILECVLENKFVNIVATKEVEKKIPRKETRNCGVQTEKTEEKSKKQMKQPKKPEKKMIPLKTHETEVRKRTKEIDKLKREVKGLIEELSNRRRSEKKKSVESKNTSKIMDKLKSDLENKTKRLSHVSAECEKLKEQVKRSDQEFHELQKKCSDLIFANETYNEEMKLIREQESGILTQANLLGSEIKRLKNIEERYYALVQEMNLRKQLADDAIERVEKLQNYLEKAREKYDDKSKEIQLLKMKDVEKEKTIEILNKRIEVLKIRLGESDVKTSLLVDEKINEHLSKEDELNRMLRKYKKKLKSMQSQFLDSLSTE